MIDSVQNNVLDYAETKNLLLKTNGIYKIFDTFSIKEIQVVKESFEIIQNIFLITSFKIKRCSDREEISIYEKNVGWSYSSLAIGLFILGAVCLFLILIAIILIIVCWTYHMKHALVAPSAEFDTIDDDSISKF